MAATSDMREPDGGAVPREAAPAMPRRLQVHFVDGDPPFLRIREAPQVEGSVGVARVERFQNGDERHLAGAVARDGRFEREFVGRQDRLPIEPGDTQRRVEILKAFAGPELELERGRGAPAPVGAELGLGCREARLLAGADVDWQCDPEADLPHGVETASVHGTAARDEVRKEVFFRERHAGPVRFNSEGQGRKFRTLSPNPFQ